MPVRVRGVRNLATPADFNYKYHEDRANSRNYGEPWSRSQAENLPALSFRSSPRRVGKDSQNQRCIGESRRVHRG